MEQAILAIVAKIPAGRVATYGQVAQLAGLPGRARLVGRVLADLPAQLLAAGPGEARPRPSADGPSVHGRSKTAAAGRARKAAKNAEACPWHRVIAAQGRIALPKASLSYVEQRRRLRAEGVIFRNDRVDLGQCQWRTHDDSPLLD